MSGRADLAQRLALSCVFASEFFWRQGMSSAYTVRPITEGQIDLAYILIDASGKAVPEFNWRTFCRGVIAGRGKADADSEVHVALDGEGHVRGLCVTEIIDSPLFGRMVQVPLFLTASAGDEDGVIVELVNVARMLGRDAGCTDIRIWAAGGKSWLRATAKSPVVSRYEGLQVNVS
jgi:hypothetical protein